MADGPTITKRQHEILDFIRDKIENRGFPPSIREIGEAFQIASPNGVMCHLKALEKKGLIKRDPFHARAIQLVERRMLSQGLPLLGRVAAGSPVLAEALQDERLNINELFEGADHFILQVRGQSMIEDHIDDGDYVVIRKQETAENGERVVARINDEVTLKKYYDENDHIRLEPANGTMQSIIVPKGEADILGVLVGVVRKC